MVPDGVSLTLNRLVAYLLRRGAEVLVFAPVARQPGMAHEGTLVPVRSIPVPSRPEYRISFGLHRSAKRRLRAFRPHLFHVATPDYLGRSALRLGVKWGIPVVASYHTHWGAYLKYFRLEEFEGLLWKYLRRFYRQCREVYVGTTGIGEVLKAHDIRGNLRLWERGVNTQFFSPEKRSLEWRRELGVADDEVVVTWVSRLVLEKRLDVFADAIRQLADEGVRCRPVVVGDGPARGLLAERLPSAIFTGFLRGEALATAYASADVFFFPSDTETVGNVTLEAMASGLPCVCADATGSGSLVIDRKTGFLAPPGDAPAFAECVKRLVLDTSLRREMATAAREATSRYDWEQAMQRMESYYRGVVNRARSQEGAP